MAKITRSAALSLSALAFALLGYGAYIVGPLKNLQEVRSTFSGTLMSQVPPVVISNSDIYQPVAALQKTAELYSAYNGPVEFKYSTKVRSDWVADIEKRSKGVFHGINVDCDGKDAVYQETAIGTQKLVKNIGDLESSGASVTIRWGKDGKAYSSSQLARSNHSLPFSFVIDNSGPGFSVSCKPNPEGKHEFVLKANMPLADLEKETEKRDDGRHLKVNGLDFLVNGVVDSKTKVVQELAIVYKSESVQDSDKAFYGLVNALKADAPVATSSIRQVVGGDSMDTRYSRWSTKFNGFNALVNKHCLIEKGKTDCQVSLKFD